MILVSKHAWSTLFQNNGHSKKLTKSTRFPNLEDHEYNKRLISSCKHLLSSNEKFKKFPGSAAIWAPIIYNPCLVSAFHLQRQVHYHTPRSHMNCHSFGNMFQISIISVLEDCRRFTEGSQRYELKNNELICYEPCSAWKPKLYGQLIHYNWMK